MTAKLQRLLLQLVFLIGVITVFSGLVQVIFPGFVLGVIGGERSAGGDHSFAIIGMFMVLFGALLIHALSTEQQEPVAILWCSIQKLGACLAVWLGVTKGLFSSLALLVAGFDGASFIIMMIFWFSIRNNRVHA